MEISFKKKKKEPREGGKRVSLNRDGGLDHLNFNIRREVTLFYIPSF